MSTLRLIKLRLQNFRSFKECEVDFHPHMTVLVAENGSGKTAILDAIATVLGPVVDELAEAHQWTGLESDDVRMVPDEHGAMTPRLPVELEAHGVFDGDRVRWEISLATVGKHARTATRELRQVRTCVKNLRSRLNSYARNDRALAPPLPFIAFYGTGRLWAEQRLTERRRRRDKTPLGRLGGYQDCLSSSSSFKAFSAWYEDLSESLRGNDWRAAHPDEDPVKLLTAVNAAVKVVLEPTGWCDLHWRFATKDEHGQVVSPGCMVVKHPAAGVLPVSWLSDGVRNMVALVADIAHRCARLNPQFGKDAAHLTPGVLLVDELDMHLHPGWQQEIAGLMRSAFPQMQIIVTTHSPQLLSTVDASSIRVLSVDDGKGDVETPDSQTLGVQSGDVLARIMNVNPTPNVKAARQLSRYKALVQQGLGAEQEAVSLRAELEGHFRPRHPLMLECDRLIKLQALKTRLPRTGHS